MANREFIGTTFVTGVHGLRSAQDLGNFRLCLIVVFTQIP